MGGYASGLPENISVIIDPNQPPIKVVLTDGSVNIGTVNAELEVQLSHKDNDPDAGDVHDSVRIGNGTNEMNVNPDGSINIGTVGGTINIRLLTDQGPDFDAVRIGDGSNSLLVNPDGSLNVQLAGGTIAVDLDAFTSTPDNVMLVGSDDGTKTGNKFGFVNNIRQQILASHDRQSEISYADFGTKNQRITEISYSSPTFPGVEVKKQFIYSLHGTRYRRDEINWVVV